MVSKNEGKTIGDSIREKVEAWENARPEFQSLYETAFSIEIYKHERVLEEIAKLKAKKQERGASPSSSVKCEDCDSGKIYSCETGCDAKPLPRGTMVCGDCGAIQGKKVERDSALALMKKMEEQRKVRITTVSEARRILKVWDCYTDEQLEIIIKQFGEITQENLDVLKPLARSLEKPTGGV